MLIGFVHSAARNDMASQRESMAMVGVERTFRSLRAALDYARPGDILVVCGPEGLASNAAELLEFLGEVQRRGVASRCLDYGWSTGDSTAVLGFVRAMAAMERKAARRRRPARVAPRTGAAEKPKLTLVA